MYPLGYVQARVESDVWAKKRIVQRGPQIGKRLNGCVGSVSVRDKPRMQTDRRTSLPKTVLPIASLGDSEDVQSRGSAYESSRSDDVIESGGRGDKVRRE